MKRILLAIAFCLIASLCLSAQRSYDNPIISGCYPDPSICRSGEDYYIVNSSFHYFPSVPLWHSRDLVHWEQIANVLDRPSQVDLTGAMRYSGIYAPTIRFDESDSTYYMVTTNVSGGGNFCVHTKDPCGGWSEPVFLEQGGIDPSFYFEDGVCYMVSNPDGCIYMCTIDPKTGKTLSQSKPLWGGTGGRYPEGPHIYKRGGWYYLMISEGGTEYGHMVTIARSRDIYGPYESNPENPILTHRDQSTQSSPIQATGHSDLVQTPDGSWYLVCLGIRPQAGQNHLLGRETFLAPVQWGSDGWPVVNGTGTIDLKMSAHLPAWCPLPQEDGVEYFGGSLLGAQWVHVRNPHQENYEHTSDGLRLHGTAAGLDSTDDSPTMVLRRQRDINCDATVCLSLTSAAKGDEAGLSVFLDAGKHYDIFLKKGVFSKKIVVRYRLDNLTHIEKEVRVRGAKEVLLRVHCEAENYTFQYSLDKGADFVSLGSMGTRYLSEEVQGGFTGCFFGLYCFSPRSQALATFRSFEYNRL